MRYWVFVVDSLSVLGVNINCSRCTLKVEDFIMAVIVNVRAEPTFISVFYSDLGTGAFACNEGPNHNASLSSYV